MSVVEGGPRSGLVARVQNILLKPTTEWDVIDGEPATVQGLFTGYAMILAAIPAVAGAIGSLIVVHNPVLAVAGAIMGYVVGLISAFANGFIIDALAPSFDGQKNLVQGMKASVYASTGVWVAGIAAIIPVVGGLVVFAGLVYTLYLLYLGLPKLMKVPQEKALGYFIVVVVVEVVIYFVFAMITGAIIGMLAIGAAVGTAAAVH
jgi:hypothetical protein